MHNRVPLVVANWKMNGDLELISSFSQYHDLSTLVGVTAVICPPALYISKFESVELKVGAQNISEYSSGAYTGELSADMLNELSVDYVIVGHSERRTIYSETDQIVAEKTLKALEKDLTPIVCIGELESERKSEQTFSVIEKQLGAIFNALSDVQLECIAIAYEPVWAIGTGLTATPEQAQEVHAFIRKMLNDRSAALGDKVHIIYGGSVKPENSKQLFSQPDIDGGLVGGASLDPKSFHEICLSAVL